MSSDDLQKMIELDRYLLTQFPIFSKVEFDDGDFDAATARNDFEWQFWLRHCCAFIRGQDLSTNIALYRPCIEIGLAINQDIEVRLSQALTQISTDWDWQQAKSLAKKLIRTDYSL